MAQMQHRKFIALSNKILYVCGPNAAQKNCSIAKQNFACLWPKCSTENLQHRQTKFCMFMAQMQHRKFVTLANKILCIYSPNATHKICSIGKQNFVCLWPKCSTQNLLHCQTRFCMFMAQMQHIHAEFDTLRFRLSVTILRQTRIKL